MRKDNYGILARTTEALTTIKVAREFTILEFNREFTQIRCGIDVDVID